TGLFRVFGFDLGEKSRGRYAAADTKYASADAAPFTRAKAAALTGTDATARTASNDAARTRSVGGWTDFRQRVAVLGHVHVGQVYIWRSDDRGLDRQLRVGVIYNSHRRGELL